MSDDNANIFSPQKPFIWTTVSFAAVLFLLVTMPLWPNNYLFSLDVRKFFPSLGLGLLFVTVLLIWFWSYWRLVALIRTGRWRPSFLSLMGFTAVLVLLLTAVYPFNANDLYRYVLRGRISLTPDGNPYVDPPSSLGDNQLLNQAGEWVDATSPYGPVWELTAEAIVTMSPDAPLGQLVMFKLLAGLIHLLTGWLIFQIGQRRAPNTNFGRVAAAVWLLNPGLLLIFIADGHNDGLMILFLVLGYWIFERGYRQRSWLLLACSLIMMSVAPLVKAIGLLPIPLFGLSALMAVESIQDRIKLFVVSVLGALGITYLAFLPFGSPFALLSRLVSEASAGASFTPAALALLVQQQLGTIDMSFFEGVSLWGTVIGALWVAWLVYQGRSPLQAAADLFIIYLIFAFNFRLWYTAWPFVFLLLDPNTSRFRLTAGHLFLLFGQLSVFVFAHLLVYVLGGNFFISHLIGVPFVYVLPPLVAFLWVRLSPSKPTFAA